MSSKTGARSVLLAVVLSRLLLCQTSNIVVGAGYAPPVPIAVAPGEIVTIYVQGVGAGLTQPVLANRLPLPSTLAGNSVSLQQCVGFSPSSCAFPSPLAVPLLAVFPVKTCTTAWLTGCGSLAGITLQIPFEMGLSAFFSNVAQLIVTENAVTGAVIELLPQLDKIHVLRYGDTITSPGTTKTQFSAADAIVTHADGSRVTNLAPAKPGETLVLWAVGLGSTTSVVPSGQATPAPAPTAPVVLEFNYAVNAEPGGPGIAAECLAQAGCIGPATTAVNQPTFSGLTPGFVGLYQVNFVVPAPPAGLPPCYSPLNPGSVTSNPLNPGLVYSNLTVIVARYYSFDGAAICVEVLP